MAAREFNFDSLVGPTHNYAGLAHGNLASLRHRHLAASPKQAALEGLKKMRTVAELGIGQCVLPPLPRPRLDTLRALGFGGDRRAIIRRAADQAPGLLAACYSAAGMWAANAATVSPAADCSDRRLHLTPANLSSSLHRSIEALSTRQVLGAVFADAAHFCVHDPLPAGLTLSDEGAANHTRLCSDYGQPGLQIFTYGRQALSDCPLPTQRFIPRQTLEASQAIARLHGLAADRQVFVQQTPQAIDAGVFHNDVIAVGNQDLLLIHQLAWVDQPQVLQQLRGLFESVAGRPLRVIEIASEQLPLDDAVQSYLFNSQLLTRPDGRMVMVCPLESQQNARSAAVLERLRSAGDPIADVVVCDLRQSMQNGGGPACLRLRVVLDERQQQAMHAGIIWTPDLADRLEQWVQRHYRDQLLPADLADESLIDEVRAAMSKLADILDLPEQPLVAGLQ